MNNKFYRKYYSDSKRWKRGSLYKSYTSSIIIHKSK